MLSNLIALGGILLAAGLAVGSIRKSHKKGGCCGCGGNCAGCGCCGTEKKA